MQQLNENKKRLKLEADPRFQELMSIKARAEEISNATLWTRTFAKVSKRTSNSGMKELEEVEDKLLKLRQAPYRDANSPVLMVDQLWLWVIDDSLLCSLRSFDIGTNTL